MKLSIAIAALFLAATTALPASARTPSGHSFYPHGGRSLNLRTGISPYHTGYGAYAAAPGIARGVARPAVTSWGRCISGLASEGYSAYPSWDVCP